MKLIPFLISSIIFNSAIAGTTELLIINSGMAEGELDQNVDQAKSTFSRFAAVSEFSVYQDPYARQRDNSQFTNMSKVAAYRDVMGKKASKPDEDIFLWLHGHNLGSNKIPWGISDPEIKSSWLSPNELSEELKSIKSPQSRVFLLATMCYAGSINPAAFENINTCGLASSSWNRASYYQSDGIQTANAFFTALNNQLNDWDMDGKTSPFEAYTFAVGRDIVNFPNLKLTSNSYIDFIEKKFQYASHEKTRGYDAENVKMDWDNFYRQVSELKLYPHNICDLSRNTRGQLFSLAELQYLPDIYRNQVQTFIDRICRENSRLLSLDIAALIEAYKVQRKSYHRLASQCEKPEKESAKISWIEKWRFMKEEIKVLGPSYEPNKKNCDHLGDIWSELEILKAKIDKETSYRLSPLPILIGIRRQIQFLKSEKSLSEKNQLLQILKCEAQPFHLKPAPHK